MDAGAGVHFGDTFYFASSDETDETCVLDVDENLVPAMSMMRTKPIDR